MFLKLEMQVEGFSMCHVAELEEQPGQPTVTMKRIVQLAPSGEVTGGGKYQAVGGPLAFDIPEVQWQLLHPQLWQEQDESLTITPVTEFEFELFWHQATALYPELS